VRIVDEGRNGEVTDGTDDQCLGRGGRTNVRAVTVRHDRHPTEARGAREVFVRIAAPAGVDNFAEVRGQRSEIRKTNPHDCLSDL
jgi:hypothetical protein